jgi:hypothetical protein
VRNIRNDFPPDILNEPSSFLDSIKVEGTVFPKGAFLILDIGTPGFLDLISWMVGVLIF